MIKNNQAKRKLKSPTFSSTLSQALQCQFQKRSRNEDAPPEELKGSNAQKKKKKSDREILIASAGTKVETDSKLSDLQVKFKKKLEGINFLLCIFSEGLSKTKY
jgi:hypothetical protein